MPDPVTRDPSASHGCSRSSAVADRTQCVIDAIAREFPDRVTTFDLWRPVKIDTGEGSGVIHVRIDESVRISFSEKMDRFYQDSVGIVEKKQERAVVVPARGLDAGDVLVRNRDGATYDVSDVTENSGVESLLIQHRQTPFVEPFEGRGTIRMATVGGLIG